MVAQKRLCQLHIRPDALTILLPSLLHSLVAESLICLKLVNPNLELGILLVIRDFLGYLFFSDATLFCLLCDWAYQGLSAVTP